MSTALTPRSRAPANPLVVEEIPVVTELTEEHIKLLYLISRYSRLSRNSSEKERWIRHVPLLVLIYEGIVSQVFDYDYAPSSEAVGNRRIYLNISQEGRDDIDDLRETGHINGLKLSAVGYQSVTAYQISALGAEVLAKRLTPKQQELVDSLIHAPGTQELLDVLWNEEGKEFILRSSSGYERRSSIMDCEDVSYVSSPYLPSSLRHGVGRATTSNADRAHLAQKGVANIRDELSEVLVLGEVAILVTEFIPFGSNQIVALNDKLGSSERVKGGMFTALVDAEPDAAQLEVDPGLTTVQILDFELSKYLNFEAEVAYPEEEGIVQIEQFGVHCEDDGTVVCGLLLESVMDRSKHHVSLDHLARILADVHQDTSQILDSVISAYQRSLLQILFTGDADARDKFTAIFAEKITPRLPAIKYMDKEDNENELKQVLGDTQSAHDLSSDELLVLGRHGLLICGPNTRRHTEIVLPYLGLMARSIFITNFYIRLFALGETLKSIRKLIESHEKNPNSIPRIRKLLNEASQQSVHMAEILQFLFESLEDFEIPPAPESDPAGQLLYSILEVATKHRNLVRRVRDLKKNITSVTHELAGLRDGTDVISETQMFRVQEALQANTKNLEDVFRSGERQSNSLEIMQVILSGTLAFELLDRVTGEWSILGTDWGQAWILQPFIERPGVWFMINLLLWGIIGYCLTLFMNYLSERSSGVLTLRMKANLPISVAALNVYLASKQIGEEEVDQHLNTRICKVSWADTSSVWHGLQPKIEISYDSRHGYLLNFYIVVDKKGSQRLQEDHVKQIFLDDLRAAGVLTEEAGGTKLEN